MNEYSELGRRKNAIEDQNVDIGWYAYRNRKKEEVHPWDQRDAGLYKDFLWQEWRDALEQKGLEDCRWIPCYDCGACTGFGLEHVVASTSPPVGGSQGTWQNLQNVSDAPGLLQIGSKNKTETVK